MVLEWPKGHISKRTTSTRRVRKFWWNSCFWKASYSLGDRFGKFNTGWDDMQQYLSPLQNNFYFTGMSLYQLSVLVLVQTFQTNSMGASNFLVIMSSLSLALVILFSISLFFSFSIYVSNTSNLFSQCCRYPATHADINESIYLHKFLH